MSTSDRLPSAWARAKLKELGSWKGGGTPSKTDTRFWVGGSVPWVSPKDMKTAEIREAEDHITEAACRETPAHKVPRGSVLVVTRSGILRRTLPVAVTRVDAAFNQDLKALVPDSGILPKFVFYALRRHEGELLHECVKEGTTVQSVEVPQFLDFELPIAPTNEQRRIADALDDHFTRLDAADAALKRAQARLKRFRASVLQAAVTGRLVPTEAELARREGRSYEPASKLLARVLAERRKWFDASGKRGKYVEPAAPDVASLPELPEGWCWVTVEQLGEVVTGTTPPTASALNYGGSLPFLKPTDLDAGYLVTNARETLSAVGEQAARAVPPLTVLVTCIGATIGKTGLARMHCAFNQQINGLIPTSEVATTRWLYWVFVSPFGQESIKGAASATTLPILNKSRFSRIEMPLPPVVEQARIITEIERRWSLAEAAESSGIHCLARTIRLRRSLLESAFRGRLVDPDPSDEPASALLARIRTARAQAASNGSPKPRRAPRRPKTTT